VPEISGRDESSFGTQVGIFFGELDMKKTIIITSILFAVNCYAGDFNLILKDGDKIERDFLNPKKLNVYDSDYKKVLTIERDFLNPEKLNIYDGNYKRVGRIEKDFYDKNRLNVIIDK